MTFCAVPNPRLRILYLCCSDLCGTSPRGRNTQIASFVGVLVRVLTLTTESAKMHPSVIYDEIAAIEDPGLLQPIPEEIKTKFNWKKLIYLKLNDDD